MNYGVSELDNLLVRDVGAAELDCVQCQESTKLAFGLIGHFLEHLFIDRRAHISMSRNHLDAKLVEAFEPGRKTGRCLKRKARC
jgi:hypothetical protein